MHALAMTHPGEPHLPLLKDQVRGGMFTDVSANNGLFTRLLLGMARYILADRRSDFDRASKSYVNNFISFGS